MHDPSTLAASITLPIPSRISKTSKGRKPGFRWPFWVIGGYEVYFGHDLIDLWHEEPGGADSGTVCKTRHLWTHLGHLRVRYPMLHSLRRRLFTTCEWCGQSGTKRNPVNVSHQWDREHRGRWWHGERGLFHSVCSTVERASHYCTCETPDSPGRFTGETCRRCQRFIDYRHEQFRIPRLMAKKIGRGRHRPTPEETERISAAFLRARGADRDD